jgi:hypothetical protein
MLLLVCGLCLFVFIALLVWAAISRPEKIRFVFKVARLLHLELEATRGSHDRPVDEPAVRGSHGRPLP